MHISLPGSGQQSGKHQKENFIPAWRIASLQAEWRACRRFRSADGKLFPTINWFSRMEIITGEWGSQPKLSHVIIPFHVKTRISLVMNQTGKLPWQLQKENS